MRNGGREASRQHADRHAKWPQKRVLTHFFGFSSPHGSHMAKEGWGISKMGPTWMDHGWNNLESKIASVTIANELGFRRMIYENSSTRREESKYVIRSFRLLTNLSRLGKKAFGVSVEPTFGKTFEVGQAFKQPPLYPHYFIIIIERIGDQVWARMMVY